MTNIQEVVAIIDRSGSMTGKESDTIGGINSTFEVLKSSLKEEDEIKVSIKLFDHEEKLLIRSLDINKVRPIERYQYQPRGQTALYDAIGNTLTYFMEKKISNSNAYNKCLIYIVTDGIENYSKKYNSDKLKKLIENAKENYEIEIIYLAANQDAILEASKIGINLEHALNYSESTKNSMGAYRSAAGVANRQRSGFNTAFTPEERSQSYGVSTPPPSRRSSDPPPLRRQKTSK
jgi:uncharacterized protein YegL